MIGFMLDSRLLLLYNVNMYIATVKNRNSKPAILLRESYREDGKIKTRTLANLTRWPKDRLDGLRQFLRGELVQCPQRLVLGRAAGALFALREICGDMGLPDILGKDRQGKLALFLVLARLVIQGSRLGACRWAREEAVEEVMGLSSFDEDDLYKTLDWLAEEQEKIELKLFRKRCAQGVPSLFLYDVTSTYLEGEENELAEYGYNRDKKRGKMQIVIGLLTDHAGDPVAVRVFEGNTSDTETVEEQVRILAEKFGVKELTLVGDRGMIKGPRIENLPEGFRYISALTKPQIRSLMSQGILQHSLFDSQVCEVIQQEVRYVLRRNPVRAREMARSREGRLETLVRFAASATEYLAAHPKGKVQTQENNCKAKLTRLKLGGWSKVVTEGRTLRIEINEEEMEEESLLDGCYVIHSDVPVTSADARTLHDRYKDLARVERDFRKLKTESLEIRPVHVRKESRTRGHVFVAMLALLVQRRMEAALSQFFGSEECPAVAEVLRNLERICLVEQHYDSVVIETLIEPSRVQAEYLKALGVTLPKKLVKKKR